MPDDRNKVNVERGFVTLERDVDWYYQREAADRAARYLTRPNGGSNQIVVKSNLGWPFDDSSSCCPLHARRILIASRRFIR